jgi:hypothetical protein
MPIDINSSLSEVSNYVFGSSWLNKILSSTLVFALVITLVIILIVILLYPAKKSAGFGHLFKLGLWIYIAVVTLVFLHDGIKNKKIENEIKSSAADRIMNPNSSVAYGDMRVSVQPAQPVAQQAAPIPVQQQPIVPQPVPVVPMAVPAPMAPIIKGGQPFSAFK